MIEFLKFDDEEKPQTKEAKELTVILGKTKGPVVCNTANRSNLILNAGTVMVNASLDEVISESYRNLQEQLNEVRQIEADPRRRTMSIGFRHNSVESAINWDWEWL